jgi:hypothetical protein
MTLATEDKPTKKDKSSSEKRLCKFRVPRIFGSVDFFQSSKVMFSNIASWEVDVS